MEKSKLNFNEKRKFIAEEKGKRMTKKLRQIKKKRLIIRNLSFKVSEEELKTLFSQFGEVLDVKIPVNEAGRKRGFAFVQFKDTKAQIKAMKKMNFQKINGRPIAIDFAIDKTTYQSHQNNLKSMKNHMLKETKFDTLGDDVDDDIIPEILQPQIDRDNSVAGENEDESDIKVKAFLKEFDADKEFQENFENETISESDEETEDESQSFSPTKNNDGNYDYSDDDTSVIKKSSKKYQSKDISEGKTIFIRNVSFKKTEEDLQEIVEEYGQIVYCLFCMDPITGHFKGTAFVKFKRKESADKLVEESSKEPGILLDGRKLECNYALSQEELSKKYDGTENVKDKRNLRLLKCGLIPYGSEESDGVSATDMAKRAQLENVKKQKLKNVNFFVSDKRLVCHNLPKNVNDKDLHALFKRAAGKEAIIKEARIMRDLKKTNDQGIAVSRGFGFIAFTKHEHAVKALMELNNNPKVFTFNKRPIVEFSVENKVALLSRERRRERMILKNKKKNEQLNKEFNQADNELQSSDPVRQKSKLSKGRKRNKPQNGQKMNDLSTLTKKYKEKLLNKLS